MLSRPAHAYAAVYRVSGDRAAPHSRLTAALEAAGGRLLYVSEATPAPVYLGIETPHGERIRRARLPVHRQPARDRGRPADEHWLQVRHGGKKVWNERAHDIDRYMAGVDTTLVLGVHVQENLLIGLDHALYGLFVIEGGGLRGTRSSASA